MSTMNCLEKRKKLMLKICYPKKTQFESMQIGIELWNLLKKQKSREEQEE